MSEAKAIPAPKASKAAKPAKPQGEFRRSVGLINRFVAGQRGVFGMAMLMLILESFTSILAKFPLTWLLDYLQQGPRQLAADVAENFALLPAAIPAAITQFFLGLSTNQVLIFLSAAILITALFNSASDSFAEIYLVKGGRLLGFTLRDRLYAHLQKLSLAFFGRQRTGDLLARVTGDVTALEDFAVKSLKDIAGSVFLIALTLLVLFTQDWRMGAIAIVTVPILSLASNYFADRIKSASKQQRAQEGALAAGAQEMLTSIRVIQVYGSAGDQQKKFAETSKKAMDIAVRVGRLTAWFGGVISLLQAVVVVIIIWVAVWLVGRGAISIGTTVLFVGLIQDLFKPTKRIIKQWNEVGKIMASAERISEVLDRKPAVDNAPNAATAPRFQGNVAFNHVSFAYMIEAEDVKDGQVRQPKLALRDVSFTIAPGEVVALVGGSGAGKSTIVQLLPRLYDPHAGAITIDDQDIRSFTLDSLRSQMSMVLQEAILFTGTVAENIAYGRPNASREEIIAAAMQASAHQFIEQLPDGYDTLLSERASNLSGGQRQRLAIARAFIRNTPVLILDEPTTGLDAESTELVLLALRELMRGKATVIISHDLNLIRQADKIIAIKDGQIAEVGTHKELLRRGGLYADLYNKQFGKAAEEQGVKIQQPVAQPARLQPALSSAPRFLEISPVVDEAEDDEAEVVAPKIFQTLIGQALPAPASEKAFQTLMMQAVVPPPPLVAKPATPPAATPLAPQAAAPAPAPIREPAGALEPGKLASAAPAPDLPPSAKPPAPQPAQAAPQPQQPPARPAVPAQAAPPASAAKEQPVAPAQASAKPAAPAAKEQPAKPKPSIFATTVMRTIPEAPPAAVGPTQHHAPAEQKQPAAPQGGEGVSLEDLTFTREMRAIQSRQSADAAQASRARLSGAQLDMLNSPVIQSELPGLRAAFDTEAMRGHIQAVLFGKARANYAVEKVEVDQATYIPGEGCQLRYQITVKDRDRGQPAEALIAGMVFPTQLAAALYLRDKLAPLVELMRGRPEIAPFATPAALVEPLNMALYAFPIDGELPALVSATDARRMRGVLSETLPQTLDNTFAIDACEGELVEYARRYRAVLRYRIEGKRSGGSRLERQTIYGKVFTSSVGALAGPVTAALRERLLNAGAGYTFNVPRSLGWRPDMQLALLEEIPGKPLLSDVLKARFKGNATEPQIMSLRDMIDSSAKIAATLHTSNIKLGRRRTIDDELAALRKGFADVRRITPELGAQLDAWLDQLATYAEQSDALNLGFCHGDYTYTQVIFAGQEAGLVDFDSVCQAEPALDVGHFLAYLKIAGYRARQLAGDTSESTLVGELSDRFMSTYLAAMNGRVDDVERLRVRVAVYQMVSLLRRALRSWQKFKGSRLENALALIEEEIACLPQLDY